MFRCSYTKDGELIHCMLPYFSNSVHSIEQVSQRTSSKFYQLLNILSFLKTNMKFLTANQKYFELGGLSSHQSIQKCPFNKRNAVSLAILNIGAISSISFLLFQSNTFEDYTFSMYGTCCIASGAFNFNIFILKVTKIFKFIDHFEKVIEKRESQVFNIWVNYFKFIRISLFIF